MLSTVPEADNYFSISKQNTSLREQWRHEIEPNEDNFTSAKTGLEGFTEEGALGTLRPCTIILKYHRTKHTKLLKEESKRHRELKNVLHT